MPIWSSEIKELKRLYESIKGQSPDLEKELDGDVFRPLRDHSYFKRFRVHPELHTLVWPNAADFAPEFLYEKMKVGV